MKHVEMTEPSAPEEERLATRGPAARTGWSAARRYLPLALIVLLLGLGYAFGVQDHITLSELGERRDALKAHVDAHFVRSIAIYLAVYTVMAAIAFPAQSVVSVIGGFLFGWQAGAAAIAVGATVGASLLFLATRSAFGDFLRRRAGGIAAGVAEGFRTNAFGYLLVLRLAPVFPFFLVNIVAALCDIRLRSFVLATFFGILPGVFAYAWLGEGVDSVLVAARAAGREPSVADLLTPQITFAFFALAAVAALPLLIRWLRQRRR
jgi:uncharacterized membrane protein YdjX (TVP38/TMEM64 family)